MAHASGDAGPLPPLVLVHGAGASADDWPAELRALPGRRVLALDLPGHGAAPCPGRSTASTRRPGRARSSAGQSSLEPPAPWTSTSGGSGPGRPDAWATARGVAVAAVTGPGTGGP